MWAYFALLAASLLLALALGANARELTIGFGSGVVAAAVWAAADEQRRRSAYRRRLQSLPGQYRIQMKGQPVAKSYGTVTLTLEGTVLRATCPGVPPAGAWDGEIIMSEEYPSSGTGSYRHTDGDAFGFQNVQVRGRDLLVHHSWVRDRVLVVDGFVWTRSDA
jgi:hypothetical protein